MDRFLSILLLLTLTATMLFGCKTQESRDPDTIKIGMTAALNGDVAFYGEDVKAGAEIAAEEINSAGDLKIELMVVNDFNDETKAVRGYQKLKQWGMQIYLGSATSGPCMATAKRAADDGMFMLSPSASSSDIAAAGDTIYLMELPAEKQGAAAAKWMSAKNLGNGIGVLYDETDCYSMNIVENFELSAKQTNLKIALKAPIRTDEEENLEDVIFACKNNHAPLVFLPVNAADAARILTLSAKMNYFPIFLSCDGADGILSVDNFNLDLADSLIFMSCFVADSTNQHRSFIDKYQQKRNGQLPSQFAALAYDAVYAVYESCKDAQINGLTSYKEAGQKLKEQFDKKIFSGITGEHQCWENRIVTRDMKAVIIADGTYKLLKNSKN